MVKVNVGVASFVVEPSAPGDWERLEGVAGFWLAAAFTVTLTLVVSVDPDAPVTVAVFTPVVADPAPTESVRVQVPFEGGAQDEPEGQAQDSPDAPQLSESDTDEVNPLMLWTVIVTFCEEPPCVTVTGPLCERSKLGVGISVQPPEPLGV